MYMYFTQLVKTSQINASVDGLHLFCNCYSTEISYYGLVKWKLIECTQIPNAPIILKTNIPV